MKQALNTPYKYEYMLKAWGGFWNKWNVDIHEEPPFEYKWFDTKEELLAEKIRLVSVAEKHGKYLTENGFRNDSTIVFMESKGYLTRFRFILQSIILDEGVIKTIEYDLGFGFFNDDEMDEIGNGSEYFKEFKYDMGAEVSDNHQRLYTTLILRLP